VEDVGIEALIAEVVADPKPERVSCHPPDIAQPASASERGIVHRVWQRITRRS